MIQTADNPETEVWRRLVEAAGARPAAPPDPSVKDYDWSVPNRFPPGQLAALARAAGEMASTLSAALSGALKTPVTLLAEGLTQHYGSGLVSTPAPAPAAGEPAPAAGDSAQAKDDKPAAAPAETSAPKGVSADGKAPAEAGAPAEDAAQATDFYLPLTGEDGRACGWLSLPVATATAWVARLLGSSGSSEEARAMSDLEKSLLLDLAASLAGALSEFLKKRGMKAVRSAGKLLLPRDIAAEDPTAEFTRFRFPVAFGGALASLSLIVPSESLSALASPGTRAAKPATEIQKDLMSHLGRVPLEAGATLGVASVTMKDVLSLESGDVLVLQTRVGEAIPLDVQGVVVAHARPASADGHYALQVTEVARADAKKLTKDG